LFFSTEYNNILFDICIGNTTGWPHSKLKLNLCACTAIRLISSVVSFLFQSFDFYPAYKVDFR